MGSKMQENSVVHAFMSGGHIFKLEIVCPHLKFPPKLRAETKARFCIVGEINNSLISIFTEHT